MYICHNNYIYLVDPTISADLSELTRQYCFGVHNIHLSCLRPQAQPLFTKEKNQLPEDKPTIHHTLGIHLYATAFKTDREMSSY